MGTVRDTMNTRYDDSVVLSKRGSNVFRQTPKKSIKTGKKIGNHWKTSVPSGKRKCIQLAVVILTTANWMHPPFSWRRPSIFLSYPIFDEVIKEFSEVHTDISRVFLNPLDPCFLKYTRKRLMQATHHKEYSHFSRKGHTRVAFKAVKG